MATVYFLVEPETETEAIKYRVKTAKYLGERSGIDAGVITNTKEQRRISSALNVRGSHLQYHKKEFKTQSSIDQESKRIEHKYSVCIRRRILAHLVQKENGLEKIDEYRKEFISLVGAYESTLKEKDIDAVFAGIGPFMAISALDAVSKSFGTDTLHISASKLEDGNSLIYDDWSLSFKSIVGWPQDTSKEKKNYTKKVVKKRIESGAMPDYVARLSLKNDLRQYTAKAGNYISKLKNKPKKKLRRALSLISDDVALSVTRQSSKLFYEEPNYKESFLFFPLHAPLDTQILYRGEPYIQQEALVKHIARNLPYGYKLYVKEHPNATGHYSTSSLLKISKEKDVKLIPPHINTHQIIKEASVILTINSTTGLEGVMHNCPVVTFGKPFYSGCESVTSVRDTFDTHSRINYALNLEVNTQENINFLTKMREATYKTDFFSDDYSSKKSEQLASAMSAVLGQKLKE